jgi:large subunit ribosomal protein L32
VGVPKKRTSKSRRNRRRAHWKLEMPNVGACPKCREPLLAHTVCASCGTYNKRQAVAIEE